MASKSHFSNPCSFRDMTFRIFSKFFREFSFNFFHKSEIPNPIVGSCQSTLKDCESCFQI